MRNYKRSKIFEENLSRGFKNHNKNIEETVNFKDLFYTFLEHKFFILFTMLLIATAALTYTLCRSAQYGADSLIKIENANQSSVNSLFQKFNLDTQVDADRIASEIAIIRSRVILEPVIKKLGLDIAVGSHYPSYFLSNLFAKESQKSLKIIHLTIPAQYYNQALHFSVIDANHFELSNHNNEKILAGIVGERISNHGVSIEIAQINAVPGKTFDIIKHPTGDVIDKLLPKLRVEELTGGNNKSTGILKISLKDSDPERLVSVLNSIVEFAEYEDKQRKSLEVSKTIDFLDEQLPIVKAGLEKAEAALNHYREVSGKIDIKFETQQILSHVTDIEKQIVETNLTKADLLQKYTEEHPLIISINRKLVELQNLKDSLFKQIRTLPSSDQIAVNLMRDVEIKNEIYLVLLNKLQETKVIRAGILSDVRVLALSHIPDTPLSRQSAIITIASLILGLIVGCIWVLVRRTFVHTVSDPQWIEENLDLMNLAIVPYSQKQNRNIEEFNASKKNLYDVIAHQSPFDPSIEALRSLRTNLDGRHPKAKNNIITITGVEQNIGKSFIATNFSFLLAQSGKKVLIVDGDLRKGKLHQYFTGHQYPGLSDYLFKTIDKSQIIKSTPYHNLDFLSCGTYLPNPSELLMSQKFKELMDSLSSQYDLIIIDSAPVLPVTDTIIIARLSGINLFVIAANRHTNSEINLALKKFENALLRVHGTIFNYPRPQLMKYGNAYEYFYNYYGENQKILEKKI